MRTRGRPHNFRRGSHREWTRILAGDEDYSRVPCGYANDEPGPHRCSVALDAQPCQPRRTSELTRSPSGIKWSAPPPYLAFLRELDRESRSA